MSFLRLVDIPQGAKFCHRNFIVNMTKIYKSIEDEKSQSMLVVGTENSEILIIDKSGLSITQSFKLPSVPVFIVA